MGMSNDVIDLKLEWYLNAGFRKVLWDKFGRDGIYFSGIKFSVPSQHISYRHHFHPSLHIST